MEKLNKTSDVKKYLEYGNLTEPFLDETVLRKELEIIAQKRRSENLDDSIEECLFDFIHQNIKMSDDKDFIIKNQFSRTAKEIFGSKIATGCTDFAYLFACFARQIGIPTTILQTTQKEWTNKFLNHLGDTKKHYGHTFCECFLNEKWVLVDPTAKNIDWKYEKYATFKIRIEWKIADSKTFLPYFRGFDLGNKQTLKEFIQKEEKEVERQFKTIYDTDEVKKRFEQIKTPERLKDFMDEIFSYGWLDTEQNEHIENMHSITNHKVSSISQIFDYKYETCVEAAKFAKYWFNKNGYECKLLFERIKRNEHKTGQLVNHSTHFYILFKDFENGWCRFEQASTDDAGVKVFGKFDKAIEHIIDDVEDIRKNQTEVNKDRDVDFNTYGIYEFQEIKDGWTYEDIDKYADQTPSIINNNITENKLCQQDMNLNNF